MRKTEEYFLSTENCRYIYPFLWPDEDHPELLEDEIEAVHKSGCGGFCLEARPFEDFGGESWWHTAKTALDAAEKRGMKVWILDDKHFPTGYANGYIKDRYPHLRRRWLFERHADVHGPKTDMQLRLPQTDESTGILAVYAYHA